MRKKPLIAIAVFVVLVAAAIPLTSLAFGHTKVQTHSIRGTDVREIVVTSRSGDVVLVPSKANVEVRETQHYVVRRPKLDQDIEDGVLTVDSHCGGHPFVLQCYADLRVTVPAGVKVTVEADSGDVRARRIDVSDAQLRSDSGDVAADLEGRQQLVWAHSDSGNVKIDTLDVRAVDAQTDSGDVSIHAGGDPHSITGHTDSGGVDVTVPKGDYAVDANTDSGAVDIDGISRDDRSAKSIQARTDSGDVTLRGR
jgi:hypothetical protein